jgi:hypothetical protein
MLNFYVVYLTDSASESLFDSEEEPDASEIKKSSFQVTTRTPSTAGKTSQYGSESQRMAVRVTTPLGKFYVLTCVMLLYYRCLSMYLRVL